MTVDPFIWLDCPDCGKLARKRLRATPFASVPCSFSQCYGGGSATPGEIAAPTTFGGQPVEIINLTPHEIRLLVQPETLFRIPPSRRVARVAVLREDAGHIDAGGWAIPLRRTAYGEVEGLPDPQPGTLYIVSSLVAAAARERDDLLIPDDLVRDEQGRVIGARGLAFPA